jgi:hypothetical protein
MIYCIWYPSGGFGHFVNAILALHGEGFIRPADKNYAFSSNGDSHELELIAPKYLHNLKTYNFDFNKTQNYSVLIDNGINDETNNFCQFFPDSQIIKICYSDISWPIIAQTSIVKAMNTDFENEVYLDKDAWSSNEQWMFREKYFLYLRDHTLRHAWRPDDNTHNLSIEALLSYTQIKETFIKFNICLTEFELLWQNWRKSNDQYLQPVVTALNIINSITTKQDLTHITDTWIQSIIYYYIWITYHVEVPHNDYTSWFTNTSDIVTMLYNHGVTI